jgi:radical SAM enzyme (TIGR01210 family)
VSSTTANLDSWIVERRPARNAVDPLRPYAFISEEERSRDGEIVAVNTIFLTNRECPWRCLMCDLWKNTLTETVPAGAIPAQIEYALTRLPAACHIKLYNGGSFFDPRAIPLADYEAIAVLLRPFEHVIVESHPALVGDSCLRFRDLLSGSLEVAMGLETANPEVLQRLNKHMTLDQF